VPTLPPAERYEAIAISDDFVLILDTATGEVVWTPVPGQWRIEPLPDAEPEIEKERYIHGKRVY
jgi:hypothetical protein